MAEIRSGLVVMFMVGTSCGGIRCDFRDLVGFYIFISVTWVIAGVAEYTN